METKLYVMHRHRRIEDNADLLFTTLSGAPARSVVETKCLFNRETGVLRSYLHSRDLFEIKPAFIRLGCLSVMMRSHYPLSHDSILASEDLWRFVSKYSASHDCKAAFKWPGIAPVLG